MSTTEWIPTVSVVLALVALLVAFFRNAWMARQVRLSSAVSIVAWLESVRPDRGVLYRIRDERKQLPWSDEEKAAASKVARSFDILGILDSLKYTDRRFVDRFYAIPAAELWAICEAWVRNERLRRGEHHLWEFEQLAKRVAKVKSNHPAVLKRSRWPRCPRR